MGAVLCCDVKLLEVRVRATGVVLYKRVKKNKNLKTCGHDLSVD